jgi:hypothetical protein
MAEPLKLQVLGESMAICRMEAKLPLPDWACEGDFYSITRSSEELSIICPADIIPTGVKADSGWHAIKVVGPLDFSLTGVLSSLLEPLAAANISILSLSTYDTDYVFVRTEVLEDALQVLQTAGHQLI